MELESDDLKALYGNRFDAESEQRQDIWAGAVRRLLPEVGAG